MPAHPKSEQFQKTATQHVFTPNEQENDTHLEDYKSLARAFLTSLSYLESSIDKRNKSDKEKIIALKKLPEKVLKEAIYSICKKYQDPSFMIEELSKIFNIVIVLLQDACHVGTEIAVSPVVSSNFIKNYKNYTNSVDESNFEIHLEDENFLDNNNLQSVYTKRKSQHSIFSAASYRKLNSVNTDHGMKSPGNVVILHYSKVEGFSSRNEIYHDAFTFQDIHNKLKNMEVVLFRIRNQTSNIGKRGIIGKILLCASSY